MEDLVLSCLESRVENNRNLYARFLVGPFIKGNALTVATALRRVLLSSVESIAITALYIQGITHEFSTIVGVRESVLELSLNFQSIVLSYDKNFFKKKDFFEDFQIGYLQIQGPKVIYANDLKLPLGIKVVDPTQYIATISREGVIALKFTIGKIDNSIISKSSSHSFSPDSTKQVIHHPVFGELVKKNILNTKKRYFYKSIYAVNSLKSISQHRLIRAQECALISRVGSSFLNKKKNNFLKKSGDRPLLSPNLQFLAYNAKFCRKKTSKTMLRFVYTDIRRKLESKTFLERVKTPTFKSLSGNLAHFAGAYKAKGFDLRSKLSRASLRLPRLQRGMACEGSENFRNKAKRSFVVPHSVRQSDASVRKGLRSKLACITFSNSGSEASQKIKEFKANLSNHSFPMQSINHVDTLQNEVFYNRNLANMRDFPQKFVGTRFSTFWLGKKISEYKSKINSVTNFVVMGVKKEIFQVRCSTYHALLSFYENLNEQLEVTSSETLLRSSTPSRALCASAALNFHKKSDKMQVMRTKRSFGLQNKLSHSGVRAITPLNSLRKLKRDTIFKKRRTNRNFFIKFRSRLVKGFDFYQAFIFSKERSKLTIDSYNSLIYKPFDSSFCFYKGLARKSLFPFRGITPEYVLRNQRLPITCNFTNIQSTDNLAGTLLDRSYAFSDASLREVNRGGCIAEGDISRERGKPKRMVCGANSCITFLPRYRERQIRKPAPKVMHDASSARQTEGAVSPKAISRTSEASIARQASARQALVCGAKSHGTKHQRGKQCKQEILLENPMEVRQVINERSTKIKTKQKPLIFSKRSTNFVKKEIKRQDKVFKSDICLRNIIPLDFTLPPVLKVNFVIEIDDEVLYLRQKIRERIILEIWTNGSIHPRQAVHDATLSLLDMFSSFRSLYQTSDYSSPLLQLPRYS